MLFNDEGKSCVLLSNVKWAYVAKNGKRYVIVFGNDSLSHQIGYELEEKRDADYKMLTDAMEI